MFQGIVGIFKADLKDGSRGFQGLSEMLHEVFRRLKVITGSFRGLQNKLGEVHSAAKKDNRAVIEVFQRVSWGNKQFQWASYKEIPAGFRTFYGQTSANPSSTLHHSLRCTSEIRSKLRIRTSGVLVYFIMSFVIVSSWPL